MKKLALAVIGLALISQANAAVTATFQRVGHTNTAPMVVECVKVTLSGTYVTGGFTWNPTGIAGSPGSSPLTHTGFRAAEWIAPSGYIYATTYANGQATTKIYSAPGTELANGAALPDATASIILYLGLQ